MRQGCEQAGCTNPAVALVADIAEPEFNAPPVASSMFLCAHHAPADCVVRT